MTVVSALSPLSLTYFFYNDGVRGLARPVRLFFYKPNTTDPVTVYTDPTLGVPYEPPVLSGGSGRAPPIYIGTEPYRVRVYDSHGELLEDIEYLPGAMAAGDGGGGGSPTPGTVLQTGDMFHSFAALTTQRTGCVRANGGIIGPPGFDVTPYPSQVERLNIDTHDLFIWLWGQDPVAVSALAVVPGGRGAGAQSDWDLNKGIRLPDLRARALAGIDSMGQAHTGRLAGVVVTPNTHDWPGVTGGTAMMVQTLAQMPGHSHTAAGEYASVAVSAANANIGLVDPKHAHIYQGTGLAQVTQGGQPAASEENLEGPATLTALQTSFEFSGTYLTQSEHTHSLVQNTHTHVISSTGGNALMQTISPFLLAVVYIKL